MKSKKKKKVPEILWRLFGERARPLIRTILSLLPPPSPVPALKSCEWCKGRHCLNCSSRQGEAAAAAFLCKSDDPPDYRKLLHQCFVVFDDNAPSYSGGFNVFSFRTQREIVAVVITTVQRENRSSGNVICNGYDKLDRSSATLELLSSAAWCLLLERVGCTFMFYLLSNTSIFLPTSVMKYHQVAGPPITRLSHRLYKRRPGYHFQQGAKKKRIVRSASGNSCSSSQNCMKPLEQDNKIDCDQTNATMVTIGCSFSADEEVTLKAFPGSINQTILPDRKHRITFSWQQCSKKKRLKVEEYDTPSTGEPCDDKYILRAECHCNIKSTLKKISMLCSCCLQFQAIGKFHKGCQIQRRSIFYNLESSSSGFPKRHELNRLRPDTVGAVSLLRKIFDLSDVDSHSQSKNCLHEGAFCGFHSSCLYHSIIKLLKSLIRRSRQCQYSRLLEKHCAPPSPLLDQDASTKETSRSEGNGRMKKLQETTNLENPEPYCSKSQVVSFLWAVCRSIIPPELLGTPSNWRILRRNIYKFIELRRYEKFSLKQCMYKLKASRFTFLADPSSPQFKCSMSKNEVAHSVESHKGLREILSNLRHKILERWIYWFFSCLIVPLVQANFYVTESEHGKQEVFYYRKTTWKKLTSEAMGSLTGQVFADLNDITVQNIVTKRSYGLSKVRFRPKKNGLRMLVNLRSPSFVPLQQFSIYGQSGENKKKRSLYQKIEKLQHSKSVNSFLLDTHAVLKNLKLNVPEKLGSTVSDYNDVYRKIYPFILDLKNGGSAMPEVYIVVSDVVKAFDSLDQDKLLGIMNDLITEPVYILAKSCEMNCSRKSVWVRDKFSLAGTDVEAGSIHGIIINWMGSKSVKKQEILYNLNEHIKHNILLYDKKFYLQKIGIPQGSIISPLLCSFYFGYLEENVILPFLEKNPEPVATHTEGEIASSHRFLMLRFTDDFLFLTTSREKASRLLSRLKRGFRDFNFQMNEKKFSANFDDGHTLWTQPNKADIGTDGIQFVQWGGLLINSHTLEIQADYSRYLNNHLRSTLTVCWQGKPASHLKERLCNFLRPKCHAIFFDSNVNSAPIVRLNIYQVFVLCAMKFHCYVRDLSCYCKLKPRFYFNAIRRSLGYMKNLIKKRMRARYLPNIQPVLKLENDEVEWLGLVAYVRVLKRKQTMHKQLLASLNSQLLKHSISRSISPELCFAVDDCHSSVIWKMKY